MKTKNNIGLLFLCLLAFIITSKTVSAAPEEVHANGPLSVWDYYLGPYDNNGKIIVFPKDTSFHLGEIIDETVPPVYSPSADIGQDIVIKISSDEKYKDWQNNVYKIILKNAFHEAPTSGIELQFRSDVKGDRITLNTTNNISNGLHEITIFSKGYNLVRTLIEVRNPAPKIQIISGEPKPGNEVTFELSGFISGLTGGIHSVTLDGTILEGNFADYYVISNRIVLINTSLITNGLHTLTVKADGYHTATYEFLVGDLNNSNVEQNGLQLDAVSSATRGGNGSGSGEVDAVSGATGTVVNADIIFKFDMVANAYILDELGLETSASEKVLSEWLSFKGRYAGIRDNSSGKFANYNQYINQAMQSKMKGEYLSFDTFYENGDYTTSGAPFTIKYMLENGRYGDILDFADANGKKIEVTMEQTYFGEDVVLNFTDSEWANAIHTIKIGSTQLYGYQYTITDNRIVIRKEVFTSGVNYITIMATGYTTFTNSLLLEASQIVVELEGIPHVNENVSILIPEKYAKEVKSVTLNGKTLFTVNQVGQQGSYKVEKNRLVVFAKEFVDTNLQLLKISASGYDDVYLKFQLLEQNGDIDIIQPNILEVIEDDNFYTVIFNKENKYWQNSVYQIELGLLNVVSSIDAEFTSNKLIIRKSIFDREFSKITLKAHNFESVNYSKPLPIVTPTFSLKNDNKEDKIQLSLPVTDANKNYLVQVTDVLLQDNSVPYSIDIESCTLDIPVSSYRDLIGFIGVTVISNGYSDSKISVALSKSESNDSTLPIVKFEKTGNYYTLTATGSEAEVWIKAITEIYLDGQKISIGYDYDKYYYYAPYYIKFQDSAFTDAGRTELRVVAKGYSDLIQEIVIDVFYNIPSTVVKSYTILQGENLNIKIDEKQLLSSEYANSVYEVIVNGEAVTYEVKKVSMDWLTSYYYLVLNYDQLPKEAGSYIVKIYARKYAPFEVTLEICLP